MSSEEKDWLKRFLNHKMLPIIVEKGDGVTAILIDPDLNGATMGQAWLILKGVPNLAPSMTDALTCGELIPSSDLSKLYNGAHDFDVDLDRSFAVQNT